MSIKESRARTFRFPRHMHGKYSTRNDQVNFYRNSFPRLNHRASKCNSHSLSHTHISSSFPFTDDSSKRCVPFPPRHTRSLARSALDFLASKKKAKSSGARRSFMHELSVSKLVQSCMCAWSLISAEINGGEAKSCIGMRKSLVALKSCG